MKSGLEEYYIIKDNKTWHFGYTTGSCAAAAAQAAASMLFSGKEVCEIQLQTPKGIPLYLEPVDPVWGEDFASCAIQKDAGDDPDVTNGLLVYAKVRRCSREEARENDFFQGEGSREHLYVKILGGIGVGTVTLPGLEQPIGAPAINPVPRSMILAEMEKVCQTYGYQGGLEVTISAPAAVELAKQTFNPRLGIENGISILGTSGIVEPMSEKALVSTIEVEMKQKSVDKKYLLVTPGNYGTDYLKNNFPYGPEDAVKCSNYVGQTIDLAVNLGLKGILFVAHIGKFVKLAGGIMNTHSREADSRMELLAANALLAGIPVEKAKEILAGVTTDEGLRVIAESDVWDQTMGLLMEKIDYHLNHRAQGRLKIGAIVFSNVYGELGRTKMADTLLAKLQEQDA